MSALEISGTAKHADSFYDRRASTRYLTIHCAQTTSAQDIDIEDVRGWHTVERGWRDVGYHYFIKRGGAIQVGRPRWALGSHVQGHNHEALGICLAGGCDAHGAEQDNFTPEQWAALALLIPYLKTFYPNAQVNGHRDFPKVDKYCPSFDVATWLRAGSADNPS